MLPLLASRVTRSDSGTGHRTSVSTVELDSGTSQHMSSTTKSGTGVQYSILYRIVWTEDKVLPYSSTVQF